MTKTNKYLLPALAVVMIFALIFVFALMLYPLYHSTFTDEYDVEIPFYLTIDGKEVEYTKTETLSRDSFIIPFIKGEKLEIKDKYGIWNVYSWKISPGLSPTENRKKPPGRVAFFVDINPLRDFRYAPRRSICADALDMRCGARGIYIVLVAKGDIWMVLKINSEKIVLPLRLLFLMSVTKSKTVLFS